MKKIIISIVLLIVLTGCTDAQRGNMFSIGSPSIITLYSGGFVVRRWESTGKVSRIQSNGWGFVDSETGKFIRVTGTVVIEN